MTERLLAHVKQEFRDLSDGDREAVLHQVVLTLNHADLSDEAIMADDADPVKLARRLRTTLPAREAEFQLGEAGGRLYDVILDECCTSLARTLVHLPQFEPRATAELLSRLSTMANQVETVLSRLPIRSLTATEGEAEDEFSRRYLAKIRDDLDHLELFGLRFERLSRPQTRLSVAYIGLSVSKEDQTTATDKRSALPVSAWYPENRENQAIRVERVLSDHRLILLRGEAGGGKSTLLRWLAVTAARSAFTDELSSLNGCTPFLIKLRSYSGGRLPRPEEFLDDVAGTIVGVMPPGWVHQRLRSGQAVLLVDGVDEVTAPQRQAVREWLKGLVNEFPAIRIVVTSRPAAANVGWLRNEGFNTAFLEQLGAADLSALVRHWHDAVRECADLPCPPEKLPAYEAKLLARLESSPHLRSLATTPLLAAMLCALNIDRETLPRSRMGLYSAALEMLLETRDAKRNIPSSWTTPMERDQKVSLLQNLAWNLSMSNRVELPKPMVQRLVSDRLMAMPQVRADSKTVLDALLQRSGVIREPVPEKIDFVHRTVQEYLTAKQAADLGDMDLLVQYAHRDQWRETVVMAAGHANDPLRRELIQGILDRAQDEPRHARRLKLLAVACLETLPSVPEELKLALDRCLADLVPPRSERAARTLATAGEPVLARLPKTLEGLSKAVANATVQTAALINGPEALEILSRYACDKRATFELYKAWRYFDVEEYAERVLALAPRGGKAIVVNSSHFAALGKISPLNEVWGQLFESSGTPIDLSVLERHSSTLRTLILYTFGAPIDDGSMPGLPYLKDVTLGAFSGEDLRCLENLPESLRSLSLINCKKVQDYSSLSRFTELESLTLFDCLALRDVSQLPALKAVESISLSRSSLPQGSLGDLVNAAPNLRVVDLEDCKWVQDLSPLRKLDLQYLELKGTAVTHLDDLVGQTNLQRLDVGGTGISDLAPLEGLTNLRVIQLSGCEGIADLRPISALPQLESIRIAGISAGVDLTPFAGNRNIEVHIEAGQEVQGGEALGDQLKVDL
ncbi:NACHT domain-containing protein [Saccharopolyspora sp. TS4A08]|uniref:NACHT domain-containing protein n=1 Tax=Saccharopolyspora ipomoeae TaxID=3042027 RepID=A0ABT6PUK8_9PSEU|nr:NACHT domain-containing protein [Saccharopolyspora sp. TS4A08]MDI2031685.1 NACHT domain-containing protein [Saccharopolyspora sp. TS4A08]